MRTKEQKEQKTPLNTQDTENQKTKTDHKIRRYVTYSLVGLSIVAALTVPFLLKPWEKPPANELSGTVPQSFLSWRPEEYTVNGKDFSTKFYNFEYFLNTHTFDFGEEHTGNKHLDPKGAEAVVHFFNGITVGSGTDASRTVTFPLVASDNTLKQMELVKSSTKDREIALIPDPANTEPKTVFGFDSRIDSGHPLTQLTDLFSKKDNYAVSVIADSGNFLDDTANQVAQAVCQQAGTWVVKNANGTVDTNTNDNALATYIGCKSFGNAFALRTRNFPYEWYKERVLSDNADQGNNPTAKLFPVSKQLYDSIPPSETVLIEQEFPRSTRYHVGKKGETLATDALETVSKAGINGVDKFIYITLAKQLDKTLNDDLFLARGYNLSDEKPMNWDKISLFNEPIVLVTAEDITRIRHAMTRKITGTDLNNRYYQYLDKQRINNLVADLSDPSAKNGSGDDVTNEAYAIFDDLEYNGFSSYSEF